jgi:hypothetical protein
VGAIVGTGTSVTMGVICLYLVIMAAFIVDS